MKTKLYAALAVVAVLATDGTAFAQVGVAVNRNPWTGRVNTTTVGRNPWTGTVGMRQTTVNPWTGAGATRTTAVNPWTGGVYRGGAAYNPWTGRGGAAFGVRRW